MKTLYYFEMDNEKNVHQGEVLMLLVKRSRKEGIQVSKEMGINQSSLSRLYKSSRISDKVKRAASSVLGIDISVFDTGIGYEVPEIQTDRVGDAGDEYRSLLAEVERLKSENARQAAEILRERKVSDDLRRALLLIAGSKDENTGVE